MGDSYVQKNGLLYTEDLKTIIGIDTSSSDFTGRVPYGAHSIVSEAFAGCTCESISLPDSVDDLPDGLFENLTELKSVKLPAGMSELPPYLFTGCSSLNKITMPNVLVSVPQGLFYGCESLLEVPFRAGLQELPEDFCNGCTSIKSLIIPDTVSTIGPHAFANCTSLETVVLPAKLYELAADAFENCPNIHNIRIEGANNLFYINKDDGNLYERAIEGEDQCKMRIASVTNTGVGFFKENVEDEPIEEPDTDDFEEDEIFSAEIGTADEEMGFEENPSENVSEFVNINEINNETSKETKMDENNVDAMLADIMGDEKARTSGAESVSVSDKESSVLSETMAIMSEEKKADNGAKVTMEELENLFAAHEEAENPENQKTEKTPEEEEQLDSKTKILVDSAKFSKVYYYDPQGESPDDADLFVIAESITTNEEGKDDFSAKLLNCCNSFARIQDFKRVFLLYGLPLDNEEFEQFYYHYINKRNVILACDAASPSALSDYGKKVCEDSRISLNKEDLRYQRQKIGVKNDTLIKLVIQNI